MNRKQKGRRGEAIAAAHLQAKGYRILAQNYKRQNAEIDIIAQQGETVVFVEVKSRTTNDFGYPEEAVGIAKRERIKRAAEYFIAEQEWHGDIRFDIIAVTWSALPEIVHFEDAFY